MSALTVLRLGALGAARVTLVHGFLGGPRAWDAVLGHLPDSLTVRAATLPGHGDRPVTDPGSFESAARWLADVIPRPADGGPDILVGYSMGGRLCLAMALAAPERWAHVVTIGADPGIVDPLARAARSEADAKLASDLMTDGIEAFVERWAALPLFQTQEKVSRTALEAQRRLRVSNTADGIAYALRVLGTGAMPDLRPALAAAAFPITFCAGSRDTKFIALAEEASGLAPEADLAVFDGVGHNVLLESPRRLARLIADRAERALSRAAAAANSAATSPVEIIRIRDKSRGAQS